MTPSPFSWTTLLATLGVTLLGGLWYYGVLWGLGKVGGLLMEVIK